jgi:hypothetical protein
VDIAVATRILTAVFVVVMLFLSDSEVTLRFNFQP